MKERLIVSDLLDFIENETVYPIALVAGIRKVGKTTVLKQLMGYYPDAVYIDLSKAGNGQEMIEDLFLDNPTNLLLLDEVSYLDCYENVAQLIHNTASGIDKPRFKVVMTGSSPAHLIKLRATKLGARAKLFRLPPIMFVEYLYFTNKIHDYQHYENVNNDDFLSYLQLKGLPNDLKLQFNNEYFDMFYYENNISNKKSYLSHSITDLKSNDLFNLTQLIAYKLSEFCSYEVTMTPKAGWQEHDSLYNLGIKVKMSKLDLSNALISNSMADVLKVRAKDKARILIFLLYSGLANIEFIEKNVYEEVFDYGQVLYLLEKVTAEKDLEQLFSTVSICLTTPLFYTRLGEDILKHMNVDIQNLYRGMLLGKMLEVYVRGIISQYTNNSILTSLKLSHLDIGDVDICLLNERLLCEVTISDKPLNEIHVTKYYPDIQCIRVCATKTKEIANKDFHRIPYAKLCCMIDTKDILGLKKTKVQVDDAGISMSTIFNKD